METNVVIALAVRPETLYLLTLLNFVMEHIKGRHYNPYCVDLRVNTYKLLHSDGECYLLLESFT